MTAANFNPLVQQLLGIEGGVSDRPRKDDPGGLTNKGITQANYDRWRSLKGLPPKSVREITDQEVIAIARTNYWTPIQGDKLPAGVDFAVFDFAFNSGASQAVRDLQRTLGVPADGIVGVRTLEALATTGEAAVINGVCDRRLAFMKGLKNWRANRNGWTSRVAHVRAQSLALAAKEAMAQPDATLTAMPLAKAEAAPEKLSRSKRLWLAIVAALTGVGNWTVEHALEYAQTANQWAHRLQQLVAPQMSYSDFLGKLAGGLAVVSVGSGALIAILQAKAHKDAKP